jgi:GNAT superfamily N-acetyltransferase
MSLVIKFEAGLRPVIKHQEHDQSSHGSWANSSERSAKEIEVQQRITQIEHKSYPVDDDGMTSNRVTAIYETKDGTKIKLLHDNEKTADGNISMTTKAYVFVPGGVKEIADLESSRPNNVIAEAGAIIDRIQVQPEYKRQGIATAMLNFARSYSQDDIKIEHSFSLTDDAKGWSGVVKHQEHDQSSHGNWATGQKGGSGLSHREMYELKKQPDPLVRKVYEAEEKNHNQIQDKTTEQPSAPNRADFEEYSDYNDAYKKYSKDFLNWSRKVTTSIISPMGEKHLDGTPRGVNGYVRDVLRQDWFVEAFGKGGVAGNNLEVKVSSTGEAGAYQFGFKGSLPVSILRVNRGYSKAEPTIVHEIAHYATTISATSPHGGHGVEFARNHIFIAGKVMGQGFANGLEKAYREAGIPLGN